MASLFMIALAVVVVGFVVAALRSALAPRAPQRYATSGDSSPSMWMGSDGGGDWSPSSSDCSPADSGSSDGGGCGDGGGGGD